MKDQARIYRSMMFVFMFGVIRAATITGTVTDSVTRTGLEGVTVSVQNTPSQAVTDAQGGFAINDLTGIADRQPSPFQEPPGRTWEQLKPEVVNLYNVNGRLLYSRSRPGMAWPLLPDGIYPFTCRPDDGRGAGILVVAGDQTAAARGPRAKAAAAVTLVLSKEFYGDREITVAAGTAAGEIKMGMWFPHEQNTGLTGVGLGYSDLTPHNGDITVTQNGTVIDKLDIWGTVHVQASNVTVKRCRIRVARTTGLSHCVRHTSGTGLTVEDCELVGNHGSGVQDYTEAAISASQARVLRCNIHSCGDGTRLHENTLLQDCYIHGFYYDPVGDAHNDGQQSWGASHLTVRHNYISNPRHQTSCILVGSEYGAPSNILIEYNRFDGGNYTIYLGPSDDRNRSIVGTDRTIRNNRFEYSYVYGIIAKPYGQCDWYGNVWYQTGAPIAKP